MIMLTFLFYATAVDKMMIKQHSADLEISGGNLEVADYEIFCLFLVNSGFYITDHFLPVLIRNVKLDKGE